MALKITRATDPIEVKTLTLCVYSVPGIGKTSLGFTAEKPLLLDFDKGVYRSRSRKDCVQVETWSDVVDISEEDLRPFKTVVLDTSGRALDVLTKDIIAANPRDGRGGALTLQGFGVLKTRFIGWLSHVRGMGLDVVLLVHSDEQKSGDDMLERLDVQGGSKNEIYKSADVMGRLYINRGKRMLNFSPTDTSFGKNPAQLKPLMVPDFGPDADFLATVIRDTKAYLNKQTAAQAQAMTLQADWKERIEHAVTAEDFAALLDPARNAHEAVREVVKLMLSKAAKAKGFRYDKTAGTFVPVEQAA